LVPRCWKTISLLSLRRNDRAVVEPALTVGAVADPGGQFPHHRRRAVAESGFVLAVAVARRFLVFLGVFAPVVR